MAGQREAANGSRPASQPASSVASQPASQPANYNNKSRSRTNSANNSNNVERNDLPTCGVEASRNGWQPARAKASDRARSEPSRAEFSAIVVWKF